MSKLIYITNTSLDGYVEDESGAFDWLNAEQVHEFITDLIRPMETYLYGRRLYEKWLLFVVNSGVRKYDSARIREDFPDFIASRIIVFIQQTDSSPPQVS